MKTLGIICARGGSKRLPGKNVKVMCGRPMVAWSVQAAGVSKRLYWRVVSTDSEEIADAARNAGGWVPYLRAPELATDDAKIADVLIDMVERMGKRWRVEPTHVMLLQATSPLRTGEDIDEALRVMEEEKPRSLITRTAGKNNGCIYLLETGMLMEKRVLWDDQTRVIEQGPHMVDVDTLEDFERAERVMKARVLGEGLERQAREKAAWGPLDSSHPHPTQTG